MRKLCHSCGTTAFETMVATAWNQSSCIHSFNKYILSDYHVPGTSGETEHSHIQTLPTQPHTLPLGNKPWYINAMKKNPPKTCLMVPPYDDTTHYRRKDGKIINGVNLGIYFIYFESLASYCLGFCNIFKRRQDQRSCGKGNRQWCGTAVREGASGEVGESHSQATSAFTTAPNLSFSTHLTPFAIHSRTIITRPWSGYQGVTEARPK